MPILRDEVDYDAWKAAYVHYVYRHAIDISLKFICLKDTVSLQNPSIKQIFDGVKPDMIGFRTVLNELHRLFGCKKTYRKNLFSKIMQYPEINLKHYDQLVSFKTKLQVYVDNQYREGKQNELKDDGGALYHIIGIKI